MNIQDGRLLQASSLLASSLLPLLAATGLSGCVQAPEAPGGGAPPSANSLLRSAEGLLAHFPTSVKSTQAWHGHEFTVGGVPVKATEAVPRASLLELVGLNVAARGTWDEGVLWEPTEGESMPSVPSLGEALQPGMELPDSAEVRRGDGIRLTSIEPL